MTTVSKRAQKATNSGSMNFDGPSTLYVGEGVSYKYTVVPNGLVLQNAFIVGSSSESEIHNGLIYTWAGGVTDLTTTDARQVLLD